MLFFHVTDLLAAWRPSRDTMKGLCAAAAGILLLL
jgi:hypothetical protein